jgi:hypothetical protein
MIAMRLLGLPKETPLRCQMGAAIGDGYLPAKQVGEFDQWLCIVARSED